jgi:hypothetical protein
MGGKEGALLIAQETDNHFLPIFSLELTSNVIDLFDTIEHHQYHCGCLCEFVWVHTSPPWDLFIPLKPPTPPQGIIGHNCHHVCDLHHIVTHNLGTLLTPLDNTGLLLSTVVSTQPCEKGGVSCV